MEKSSPIIDQLWQVHEQSQQFALSQVNHSLTLRKWLFGFYLTEHELDGSRAEYETEKLKNIAEQLAERRIKGMSHSAVYRFKQFYNCYPQIFVTVSQKVQLSENQIPTLPND